MRPIGMVDTVRAMASAGCLSTTGVSVGPGLVTLERIRWSLRSYLAIVVKFGSELSHLTIRYTILPHLHTFSSIPVGEEGERVLAFGSVAQIA
jgi:hypothetical protein